MSKILFGALMLLSMAGAAPGFSDLSLPLVFAVAILGHETFKGGAR